jgi:hypothetical protein
MMNKRKFISVVVGSSIVIGATTYLFSDKHNFSRADIKPIDDHNSILQPDEKEILFLASLAPSGHNTQPWFVQYLEPYHWIIGNDRAKWLPAVDPTQRETMKILNQSMGISEPIQFILRIGYVKNYPPPVSLRRPVDGFVRRSS